MNCAVVELRSFSLLRDGLPIFVPVNLVLQPGEIVSVRGENGAGKSTLLRSLAGISWPGLKPLGHSAVLDIPPTASAVTRARSGVCLLRQIPSGYDNLTVCDQVVIGAMSPYSLINTLFSQSLSAERRHARLLAQKALLEFGLETCAHEWVKNLSVGQRRALSLAAVRVRLELGRLRLLLVDEPRSGLDSDRRRRLSSFLSDVTRKGCAVLVAEHVSEEENALADRALVLVGRNGDKA